MIGKKSYIRKIYLMVYIWWYRDNLVYTSERNTYTLNNCVLIKTFYNKSSFHLPDVKDYANIYLYWDKDLSRPYSDFKNRVSHLSYQFDGGNMNISHGLNRWIRDFFGTRYCDWNDDWECFVMNYKRGEVLKEIL